LNQNGDQGESPEDHSAIGKKEGRPEAAFDQYVVGQAWT
jgi:hypothetical protein